MAVVWSNKKVSFTLLLMKLLVGLLLVGLFVELQRSLKGDRRENASLTFSKGTCFAAERSCTTALSSPFSSLFGSLFSRLFSSAFSPLFSSLLRLSWVGRFCCVTGPCSAFFKVSFAVQLAGQFVESERAEETLAEPLEHLEEPPGEPLEEPLEQVLTSSVSAGWIEPFAALPAYAPDALPSLTVKRCSGGEAWTACFVSAWVLRSLSLHLLSSVLQSAS